MKPRPLCSLCKTREAELKGYAKDGHPRYRSRCAACRAAGRVAHGLPSRRGKEGMPGAPRCPVCGYPWKACPTCGAALDASTVESRMREGRSLLVLREIGNRGGRVSYAEFLAIAARLGYDHAGADALLGEQVRRVKGDAEMTRDGYELLDGIGLRPAYRLLGHPSSDDGNGRKT